MCEAGNRVVYDEDGSFIQNKKTGKVTKMNKKKGVYVFNLWVKKEKGTEKDEGKEKAKGKDDMDIGTVEQGFHRLHSEV